VASAYGWVTIVILSMVKQAHPSYSNTIYHILSSNNLPLRDEGMMDSELYDMYHQNKKVFSIQNIYIF
jgi:hypothetical protein